MTAFHVKPEREVTDRLIKSAQQSERIRVLILTSSRIGATPSTDALSDYDVVVVLEGTAPNRDEPFELYGEPLVRFDDHRLMLGFQTTTRLMLYDDWTKIDYQFWPKDLLLQISASHELPRNLDVGWSALVDKDGLTTALPHASRTVYITRQPSPEEFEALIEEFWWESQYVAKNLWRGELLPAKPPSSQS